MISLAKSTYLAFFVQSRGFLPSLSAEPEFHCAASALMALIDRGHQCVKPSHS